jgi:hypothetical protein
VNAAAELSKVKQSDITNVAMDGMVKVKDLSETTVESLKKVDQEAVKSAWDSLRNFTGDIINDPKLAT